MFCDLSSLIARSSLQENLPLAAFSSNLLENREMLLDDGRFLVSSNRFAKLLQSSSQEQLNKLKIVCVDSNFQVIALGLPVIASFLSILIVLPPPQLFTKYWHSLMLSFY